MIESTFNAPGYQPPMLPATALELLEISRRPDVTFPVVATLIRKEPLIASKVLRLAQSPAYRRASPVRSLEQAASLIGLRTLADLFMQAALAIRVFRVPAYANPMSQLRDHSAATAIVSRLVCQEISLPHDYAFLCGLLHDVGSVACILALADRFGENPPPLADVWPVIRSMHEVASARLAEIWELPSDIGVVIGHHHSLAWKASACPLAAVVCIADSIATELGYAFESEVDEDQVARAKSDLGLSDEQMSGVRRTAEWLLHAG
jgi:HD-like signal output (HDOD) protein